MIKPKTFALIALVALLATPIVAFEVYAANEQEQDNKDFLEALVSGAGFATAGTGALSGLMVSLLKVWGFNQKHKDRMGLDGKLTFINIVIGLGVGYVLGVVGISGDMIKANPELVLFVSAAVNFFSIHIFNALIRTPFSVWLEGLKAPQQTKKEKSD